MKPGKRKNGEAEEVGVKQFYETIGYRIVRREFQTPAIIDYLEREDDYLMRTVPLHARLLDVGCGEGRHLSLLRDMLDYGVGIENSSSILETAKIVLAGYGDIELRRADARKIPFPDNWFGISVCMFNTLLNIPHPERVLGEMARVTRPSGRIIVSVYSENALEERKRFYFEKLGLTEKKIVGGKIYAKEGFISDQVSRDELEEMFLGVGLEASIEGLGPIGYVADGKVLL